MLELAERVPWSAAAGTLDGMATAESFPPVEGERALLLVLGSMPGVRSLAAREYYAHPRNAFWRILGGLGVDPEWSYGRRCAALKLLELALWDVLATCERKGSLDTAIRNADPNDLGRLARRHPELRAILFNGTKARDLFERFVRAGDPRVRIPGGLELLTLPSTSPANTRNNKLAVWAETLGRLGAPAL